MIVRRARIRLTLFFIAMFAVVLVAFSVVFYGAFAVVLQPDFDIAPELTTEQVAEAAFNAAITQVGIALVVADLVAILIVGVVAWFMARRTLEPVFDAHRRQQRFVADASHEMRNPLAAIKATSETALSGDRSAEELRAALQTVDAATDRLTRLTGDLLLLARTNNPLGPASRVPSDLSVIASEATDTPRRSAPDGSGIERDLQADLPVLVDPDEVLRIVRNLVDNALRHGGATPVRIRTYAEDGTVVLEVRDSGPGIAADDLGRIFDPFYRAGGQVRDHAGTGLGLAIARDLAERNRGQLTAMSTPGEGATFRLSLPRLR